MALNIRDPEVKALTAELARITGETKTEAVVQALRDRLARIRPDHRMPGLADRLVAIGRECAALPVLDERSTDEILGYSVDGPSTDGG